MPTFWIMVFGTGKIPLPMTVPTTIDAAKPLRCMVTLQFRAGCSFHLANYSSGMV